jgi:Flp pilus assembly protein TadG
MKREMREMAMLRSLMLRFARDQLGAVYIMVAAGLFATVVSVGMAVELSNYNNYKSRFRNALDQAVLAVASTGGTVEDINQYAMEYFKTNLPEGGKGLTLEEFNVTANATNSEWRGKATGRINTSIGNIIGIGSLELSHEAVAAWDNRVKTEIVAMVDVSGTMCANFQRTRQQNGTTAIDFIPDRNCVKLHMMQEGLRNIVDIGVGYIGSGKGKVAEPVFAVGLVPFTYKVRLPNPGAVPAFLLAGERQTCIGRRCTSGTTLQVAGDPNYFTNLSDVDADGPRLQSVLPLRDIKGESDKAAFLKDIDNLVSKNNAEFERRFMKRSSLGTQIAALMLDPRYNGMFGGVMPRAFGAANTEKVVIMMTDSANLGCCYTNWPANNFRNNYIYSYKDDHEHLVGTTNQPGVCQQMKDAGIQIYTVLLDVEEADANARGGEIIEAFEGCATNKDYAFRVPYNDKATLKEVYTIIGRSLMKLRLTE